MAEIWGLAVAAVVGTVGGAVIASNGAKSAAQTAANAATSAAQVQQNMFNKTQANIAPQIEMGQDATTALDHLNGFIGGKPDYSAFDNSPGYQFTLQEGEQAINKQAAASGNLYSTGTLAAQNNYAQDAASTQYNNYVGQLLQMAGLGNGAAGTGATAGIAAGSQIGNSLTNAGNAQASGILGQSNAFSNALGSISNNSNLMNALNGSGGSTAVTFNGGQGTAGLLDAGGGTQATSIGDVTAYCDYGLKKNIEPYRFNGMSNLQVYDFHYKTQDDAEDKHRGYIAQEVLEQYPEAVSVGPKGFLMVDYSKVPGWDELDELGSMQ
jgi:hypothetical protein